MGFNAVLRDFGRLGQLMLDGRQCADGRAVLPAGWVSAEMTTHAAHRRAADARLRLSRSGRSTTSRAPIAAVGLAGQFIYVHPQTRTVIVKLSYYPPVRARVRDARDDGHVQGDRRGAGSLSRHEDCLGARLRAGRAPAGAVQARSLYVEAGGLIESKRATSPPASACSPKTADRADRALRRDTRGRRAGRLVALHGAARPDRPPHPPRRCRADADLALPIKTSPQATALIGAQQRAHHAARRASPPCATSAPIAG